MGIQINGNTNNINAGIGSLSIEDINELDIVGVATAANFKTGVSNLHSVGLTLTGGQIDVGSNIKIGTAGVVTATSFVGSGANLTGIVGGATGVDFNDNIKVRLGTGNDCELYHNGTDTYIANATNNFRIGNTGSTNLKFFTNNSTRWNIDGSGHFVPDTDSQVDIGTNSVRVRNIYADTLYGSGANLTGITGTTINNNANNRVITGSGSANTLEGESALTFDGSTLNLTSASGDARVTLIGTEGNDARLSLVSDDGDDHIDQYNLRVDASDNSFYIDQFESGSFIPRFRIANGGKIVMGSSTTSTTQLDIRFTDTTTYSATSNHPNGLKIFNDCATDNGFAGIELAATDGQDYYGSTLLKSIADGTNYTNDFVIQTRIGGNYASRLRIASSGHTILSDSLGVGGQDPGGSTLRVHGSIYASLGGNTSWQKLQLEGSNNTAGDAFSINNWGDAEGDYWGLMVNQTMNQSGNYSKTNSGKRTSYITIDGRMGRVYLGGSSTSGNPTDHFYTNWNGSIYADADYGSPRAMYPCRAWANLSGDSSPATIRVSRGIGGFTDLGTGDYRFTFSSAMTDNNYSALCSSAGDAGWSMVPHIYSHNDMTTTTVRFSINAVNVSGQNYDRDIFCMAIFR